MSVIRGRGLTRPVRRLAASLLPRRTGSSHPQLEFLPAGAGPSSRQERNEASSWVEGKHSPQQFDNELYLSTYPDVKAARMDGYEHFINYGKHEGRVAHLIQRRAVEPSSPKQAEKLEQGKRLPGDLAHADPDLVRAVVEEVFQGLLKRSPGPQGLVNYPRRLREEPGYGLREFVSELIERPEFQLLSSSRSGSGSRVVPIDVAVVGLDNGTGLARNAEMFYRACSTLRAVFVSADTAKVVRSSTPLVTPEDSNVTLRPAAILFCVNADSIPMVAVRVRKIIEGGRHIGFLLWETSVPPPSHRLGLSMLESVWVPTAYVRDAYSTLTSQKVEVVGKGLEDRPKTLDALVHDPNGAFRFLSIADFGSSIYRKNPLAVVRAFTDAFPAVEYPGVRLVLKVRNRNSKHWSNIDRHWEEVEILSALDGRIGFLEAELSFGQYWALLYSCQALVSLHRSEGFGYALADALLAEKPVISSRYSGPLDFLNEDNSYLVDVDLVKVALGAMPESERGGEWAEPSHDGAVQAFRRVYEHYGEARAKAERGRLDVLELYEEHAWRGRIVRKLLELADSERPRESTGGAAV